MSTSAPRRPSVLRRALDRMRFILERLVLRGLSHRLLLAAAIVAAVSVLAGALAVIFDPASGELGDAVWWAFLRLTDPGYLGDDEGVARRTISTIVTVLGYVLFLGLLIAILTQWLTKTIATLESGVTPVAFSDHVVILGWTFRTPTIVSELLRTRSRVERFLEREGARQLRIVILAEHVDQELARELREQLGTLWNDRQVLLRSGSPLRLDHLERVAFRDAAVLILPGADFAERNPAAVDAQTVKTLLSVSRHAGASGAAPPLAVAELCDARKATIARRAYAGETEVIPADELVSRIISQSIRQHGLCDVFTELLTLDEGNAIFVRPAGGEVGVAFGDLCGGSPRAILIGTVREGDPRATLKPPPETIVVGEDLLVFIARRYEDCVCAAVRSPGATTPTAATPPPELDRQRRVLILGWSRVVPALLGELRRYGKDTFEIDVVSSTPLAERESALARLGDEAPSDRVHQIEAGFSVPGVLERLDPQRYDNVVLLASERLTEEDKVDATTVSAYLTLDHLLVETDPRPDILVELIDEENRFLFAEGRDDVIVSPTMVSYSISQVSLRRELAAVYTELARPRGAQIALHPAREYLATDGAVRFEDVERAAAARGRIALGLRRRSGPGAGLALNPDRDTEWALGEGDEVVVMASYDETDD